MSSATNAKKISQFVEWMQGDHVLLHLDSRKDGVDLPTHLMGLANVTLKLSYMFQGETQHTDEAVEAYLKFGGQYYRCIVPWDAVWALSSEEGETKLWMDALPDELVRLASSPIRSSHEDHEVEEGPPQTSRPKPQLRRVK